MADRTVLFEAGQTRPRFLEQAVNKQRGVKIPGIVDQDSSAKFFIELWVLLDLHTFTVIGLGPLGEPVTWMDLHGRQEGIDRLAPIRACGQTVMPEVKTMEVQNAKDSPVQDSAVNKFHGSLLSLNKP
ncbi:hypothetical protein H0E87_009457 [Populus deltoides]|uniref:Uncharacterized protein n=1 Tax=Populus deltoides TaxID=3696 RepID=A0A8T2Z4L2_POPDE|nr:hypothetical protein H0E87_009457 [Populus deltoides]